MAKTFEVLTTGSMTPVYEFVNFSDFHPSKQGRIRYLVSITTKMRKELDAIRAESDRIAVILKAPTQEQLDAARKLMARALREQEIVPPDEFEAARKITRAPRFADQITPEERATAEAEEKANNEHALAFTASLVMADTETGTERLAVEDWKAFLAAQEDESDVVFAAWVQNEITSHVTEYLTQSFLAYRRSQKKS